MRLNFRLKGYVLHQYLWTVKLGNGHSTTLMLDVFTQKLCDRLYLFENEFYFLQTKNRFFSHPLGDLGVTYTLHLWLVGKAMVDFLFIIIELFCYLIRLRHYRWKSVEVCVFRGCWVTLSANFRQKGASPTNHSWCQKTRVIAFSCGIKIFAVDWLFLSQSTRVTDGQTELR